MTTPTGWPVYRCESQVIETALQKLKDAGLVSQEVFTVPGTSITPVMERLLYMLSSLRRPRRAIGLGTYCGNALVWTVGPGCGPGRAYKAEKVYGIDAYLTRAESRNHKGDMHNERAGAFTG